MHKFKYLPTPAETHAIKFLHDHGASTAREYFDHGLKGKATAASAASSVLQVLVAKGFAIKESDGRAFRYSPLLSEAELGIAALDNVLDSVFSGSLTKLRQTLTIVEGQRQFVDSQEGFPRSSVSPAIVRTSDARKPGR